jgi:hypothetical protein
MELTCFAPNALLFALQLDASGLKLQAHFFKAFLKLF